MRIPPRFPNFLRICLAVPAALSLPAALHATTTFTFEGFAKNANFANTYGDSVSASGTGYAVSMGEQMSGTPGIDVTWQVAPVTSGTQYYNDWDGRGSVAQLDYTQPNTAAGISWTFTPAAGNKAKIQQFDLDEWNGGGAMSITWTVSGPTSGTLASGTWTRSTGGRDTISPNVTSAAGEILTLSFVKNSGNGSYVAVDNLVLDQVIADDPLIVSFSSPLSVIGGNSFNLEWELANAASATTLTLSDGTDTFNVLPNTNTNTGFGSYEVNPTTNTTYTLTLDGNLTKQVIILAGQAVSLTGSASVALSPDHQVTLNWQVQGPDGAPVTISDGTTVHDVTADTVGGAGSKAFTVPSASTTFTLEANHSGVTRTVQVLREQASSANLAISAPTITVGSPMTVTWANAAGGPTDWIGIYRTNQIPGTSESVQWNYLNGTHTTGGSNPSGTMSFSGLPTGNYFACLLLNDGYTIAQGPVIFSVVDPPPAPTIIRVLNVQRTGNQFTLEWESRTDRVYDIYASGDLQGDPLVDWTKIADDHPAEGDGSTSYTEDLGATAPPRRFYKIYEYTAPAP